MTTKSTVILLVLAFVALAGAALAHVSLRLGTVRLGYEIGDAQKTRRELAEARRKLTTELSMLENPARVRALAEQHLGMTMPDPARIRTVRPGTATLALSDTPRR
jgi:cell division protein FtsL